jgi:glycosyltransferase involved in cell wall biosynthesis
MITATISTYNREKYLPQVLDSLKNQTLNHSFFEILMVDNNSPGNTKEISDEFEAQNPSLNYAYFLETNQGLSYGRNRGIKEAKGKYITFIDDDAFLAEDYLEKIYNYFEANKNVAAIGSKILLHYEDIIPDWENKYLNSLLGYFNLGDQEKIFTKNDYPRGSNMSFRMGVFEKIGEFNVSLGRNKGGLGGGEEKDIFNRIYQFPELKVVYIPNALVYHCVPIERTTEKFIKRQAIGTGVSERFRTKYESSTSYYKRLLIELFKWGASFYLAVIFLFKNQAAKSKMILKFRWWVSKGLLIGDKEK